MKQNPLALKRTDSTIMVVVQNKITMVPSPRKVRQIKEKNEG